MDDRNHPAGRNLAATLTLNSVARSRTRHLSRATLADGPLMFEFGRSAVGRDAADEARARDAAAKSPVEWARHLAASVDRLRGEARGRAR